MEQCELKAFQYGELTLNAAKYACEQYFQFQSHGYTKEEYVENQNFLADEIISQ